MIEFYVTNHLSACPVAFRGILCFSFVFLNVYVDWRLGEQNSVHLSLCV